MASKIADKDAADEIRVLNETIGFLRQSELGQRLFAKLDDIERRATQRAMGGKTPEDLSAYMESRGEVRTVMTIRELFTDIEAQQQEALDFLASESAKQNREV